MIGVRHPHWPGLVTGFSGTVNANNTGFGGFSLRTQIPNASIIFTGRSSFVRVRLNPPSTGNSTPINNCFIGNIGVAPNFDGGQQRVTFGGANGVTLTAGGAAVVSDIIGINLNPATDIMLAFDFGATADLRNNTGVGATFIQYIKAAAAEASLTTVAGYTTGTNRLNIVDLVEVG